MMGWYRQVQMCGGTSQVHTPELVSRPMPLHHRPPSQRDIKLVALGGTTDGPGSEIAIAGGRRNRAKQTIEKDPEEKTGKTRRGDPGTTDERAVPFSVSVNRGGSPRMNTRNLIQTADNLSLFPSCRKSSGWRSVSLVRGAAWSSLDVDSHDADFVSLIARCLKRGLGISRGSDTVCSHGQLFFPHTPKFG